MSYSRWLESQWYVYPHSGGWIECDFAGGPFLQWKPDVPYEDFKAVVQEKITDAEAREELYEILDENMDAIQKYFDDFNEGRKQRKKMITEHQRAVHNDFMRAVYNVLNDDSIPIVEIIARTTDGRLLSYTPGHEYRPKEDIAKEKEEGK